MTTTPQTTTTTLTLEQIIKRAERVRYMLRVTAPNSHTGQECDLLLRDLRALSAVPPSRSEGRDTGQLGEAWRQVRDLLDRGDCGCGHCLGVKDALHVLEKIAAVPVSTSAPGEETEQAGTRRPEDWSDASNARWPDQRLAARSVAPSGGQEQDEWSANLLRVTERLEDAGEDAATGDIEYGDLMRLCDQSAVFLRALSQRLAIPVTPPSDQMARVRREVEALQPAEENGSVHRMGFEDGIDAVLAVLDRITKS